MKSDGGPPLQLFNCAHADCGATFTRQWRLKEHETVHTGAVWRADLKLAIKVCILKVGLSYF